NASAVRAEGEPGHPIGVSRQGVEQLTGGRVPDFRRRVEAAGGQPPAVRAERHRHNPIGMPRNCEEFLAGLGVPDLGRPVAAAGGQAPAVRAEGGTAYWARVPLEREELEN